MLLWKEHKPFAFCSKHLHSPADTVVCFLCLQDLFPAQYDLKYGHGSLYAEFSYLLTSLNQCWLSSANLQLFSDTIHQKGIPLDNCWGFVDGTV